MPSVPRAATSAATVLEHIRPDTDIIVGACNSEPLTVLDAIEAHADRLERSASTRFSRSVTALTAPGRSAIGSATSPTSCRRRRASASSAAAWTSFRTT